MTPAVGGVARFPHRFRSVSGIGMYAWLSGLLMYLLVLGVFRHGATVLIAALACVAGATIVEAVLGLLRLDPAIRIRPNLWRAAYFGLLIAAVAPLGISPAVLALSGASAAAIGSWLAGGSSVAWLHPSLVGLAVIPLASVPFGVQGLPASETALNALNSMGLFPVLERYLFAPLELSVGPDAIALLFGITPEAAVSATAGFVVFLLPVAMILLGEDIVPMALPITFFMSFVIVSDLLGPHVLGIVATGNGPVLGLLALGNPGSRPLHLTGLVAFGLISGVLSAVFSAAGLTLPVVAGILAAGTLVPCIDWLVERWSRR